MGFESVYKLSVIMSVIDNLSSPIKSISGNVDNAISKIDGMSQGFSSMTQSGLALVGTGKEITEAVLKPVEATFETRRAIGELSSLGVKDLQKIEDAASAFSNTFAGTSKADFISAAYDIKSGIASLTDEGVAQYTELAGQTAVATKATVATMTDLFATGYGIYKDFYSDLSDLEFAEMFSAGISESVKNFKTTGTGMSDAIRMLGASATTAGVPLEEQLSVLGMLQATMSGSEAGTKYKAFLKSVAKGGEELGLSFIDANGQLLSMPEILDKLKGKFGETMDAAEKMELQSAFGDEGAVSLVDLMYTKTGQLEDNIISMYGSLAKGTAATSEMADAINSTEPAKFDVLKQKIQNTAESLGNSMLPTVTEYMSKISDLLGKVDTWIKNHQELASTIMTVILVLGLLMTSAGVVTTVIGGVGLLFTRTGSLVLGAFQMLTKFHSGLETLYIKAMYASDGLKKAGSAVLSFVQTMAQNGMAALKSFGTGILTAGQSAASFARQLGLSALTAVKNFGVSLLSMARQAIVSAVSALSGLITSVWSFTAALLANPVTWVVIGIIALVAAIILLWNKCEWFRVGVTGIFAFMKAGFSSALATVKTVFSAISTVIGSVMTAAKDTVNEKLNNMKQAYTQHGGGIRGIAAAAVEGVKGFYTAGFTFIDNLTGGKLTEIREKFSEGIQKIQDKITNAISWFKTSGEKIMTTFTEGIKAGLNKPVEAVKGGLQKIRNMLPFSDAKTGPLNQLTLSGRKVMTTFAGGISQEEKLPSETIRKSFDQMDFSVAKREPETGKGKTDGKETGKFGKKAASREKKTIIEQLVMNVDIRNLKELKKLLQLIEEIEDYTNGNGPDEEPEPQLV